MNSKLHAIYHKLYARFGPQYWWPAQTPFEVMTGAILTQNTNWRNVEKAISNLKRNKLLSARKLYHLPHSKLIALIRPAGYYNVKARRLKEFLRFFIETYAASAKRMSSVCWVTLRKQLLSVKGIGPETADSILLYALNKPVFVVDAYTRRILSRHGFIRDDHSYDDIRALFMDNLRNNAAFFNEYHALLVRIGKEFCLKGERRCGTCPLKKI